MHVHYRSCEREIPKHNQLNGTESLRRYQSITGQGIRRF